MRSRTTIATLSLLTGAAAAEPPRTSAEPQASGSQYSLTIQTAPRLPQDVWIAAKGSDEAGWKGGGSICLGVLAQGFVAGQSVTILTDVVSAGVLGLDGSPVPAADQHGDPIVYTAPGIELPDRDFTVTPGETFFAIIDGFIVESTVDGFEVGMGIDLMFTWDFRFGYHTAEFVAWFPDGGGGWVPFLNEGVMMANVRELR